MCSQVDRALPTPNMYVYGGVNVFPSGWGHIHRGILGLKCS